MKKLRASICALALNSLLAVGANAQPNLLNAGDFEGITSLTTYSAPATDVWGTETSLLSGAGNGVTPFGSQMLLLTHGGGGSASQTNQIIEGPFVAGSVVTFTAKFNTWLAGKSVALVIQPNAGLTLTGPRPTSPTLALDTDTSTWQTVTVSTTLASDTNYISAEIVLWQASGALPAGTPQAYVDDAVLTVVPPQVAVFASGITSVTTWDPIFPATALPNWTVTESNPSGPTVGPNANWVNPHAASVFPRGTHPWENSPPMDFDASWINYRPILASEGPGGHSWSKYSIVVTGQGQFVLQFLADNLSWIYIDDVLVGYQGVDWANGTGRYTINLTGAGPHELSFIIFDGGGAAGGKFRLETVQSFQENNPGEELPPPPPPSDTTPPVIAAPADITTEATGPDGALVGFTATATDDTDGSVGVLANPSSGSTFPLGTSAVDLIAADVAGNVALASFNVTVQDTTPPVITPPANIVTEATGAAGATVSFAVPAAADLVSGNVTVGATPTSGSTFALGATTVALSAADAAGNASTASFSVTVQDTTAPVITPPANIVAEATSAAGASVSFTVPAAADLVSGSVTVGATPASGSTFALGTTTVNLSTADAVGNAAAASFAVTVRDTTPPVITPPANVVAEATSAAGASVAFAVAPAADLVSGSVPVVAARASGSTFPLGTTTVGLSTADAAGNAAAASFAVTVRDTTAPVITPPANIVVEATSAAGAAVTFGASATDAVGVAALTYSTASGSTFPLGITTVTLNAVDAAGNASTASFTVTVRDTTAAVIQGLTATPGVLWPPNHKLVAVTLTALVSDVVDPAPLTRIVSVSSLELPKTSRDDDCDDDDEHDRKIRHSRNDPDWVITGDLTLQLRAERAGQGGGRVYTITVESSDAAGNVSTGTVTVTVPKSQGRGHDNHKGDKNDDKKGDRDDDKKDGRKGDKNEGKKDGRRG